MRELVFKNLTSLDKKRRDLLISETVEKNGIKTVAKRHSVYIVGGHTKFIDSDAFESIQKAAHQNYNKRHIFISKKKNTRLGKDTFICDVVGKCYAVVKNEIYTVAFKHSFEIDFVNTQAK